MADTITKTWGIGGRTITVTVERTLAAAGDYAAEDVLSDDADNGEGTAISFTGIGKNKGAGGYITKSSILCSATALTPKFTLYLFNQTPTSELDDNAVNTAVLTADRLNYVGKIDYPAMEDLGGNSETLCTPSTYGNLPLSFNCDESSDSLYGVLVTRDAITGEAAGMTIAISLTSEIH